MPGLALQTRRQETFSVDATRAFMGSKVNCGKEAEI
jgi:hypothetical protein